MSENTNVVASPGLLRSLGRTLGALVLMPAAGPALKKPATLAYGLEEVPPPLVVWVSALQHVSTCAMFMIYPLIVMTQASLPAGQIVNILQLGLLVIALATLLQGLPRGPVGSRMLAPSTFTGIYLAPSLLAMKVGGPPLAWGMTIFAGLFEIALSRIWSRLRPFIPPESAGLVVFLIGAVIGLAALRVLLDESSGALTAQGATVASCALAAMAALNIWTKGRPKLFCILIGIVVGYCISGAVGLLTVEDLRGVLSGPLFAAPSISGISFAFDWTLVLPFCVSGLAAAMTATAGLTTYQRLTDSEWVRPDMSSIGRGVLSDGIANTIAGLLGTYGVTVSSANVGLVAATGVASRRIAFAIAALLVLAAFQPALLGVLTIMPRPVMAAALLFTAVFIMIDGVQIIATRVLDGRRTLVIGMGMISFFMVSVYPAAFQGAPQWAQPLVGSPLVIGTMVALALNLVFRIGIRRKVQTAVDPGAVDAEEISKFIETNAGIWGARRDVVSRLEFAVQQTIEAVIEACEPKGRVTLTVGYDEFVIDAIVTYCGAPLEFPDRPPTSDEVVETEEGHRKLAGFLIRRFADRTRVTSNGDQTMLHLRFDH